MYSLLVYKVELTLYPKFNLVLEKTLMFLINFFTFNRQVVVTR